MAHKCAKKTWLLALVLFVSSVAFAERPTLELSHDGSFQQPLAVYSELFIDGSFGKRILNAVRKNILGLPTLAQQIDV